MATTDREAAVREFVREGMRAAEEVDWVLFDETPLAIQRRLFRRYLWQLLVVFIGAAVTWYLLGYYIMIDALRGVGWLALGLAAVIAVRGAKRNRRDNVIPNGRLVGDDDVALGTAILGGVAGAVGSDFVGIGAIDGLLIGAYYGGLYGLLDAVSSRFERPKETRQWRARPWRKRLPGLAIHLVPSPLVAGAVGLVAESASPGTGWMWALGCLLVFARAQLSDPELMKEPKAVGADCIGAFLWGGMLGVAYEQITNERILADMGGEIILPVFLGWMAMTYAVQSGLPLGEGPGRTKIARALGLAIGSSISMLLLMWLSRQLLAGDAALLGSGLSPYVSFLGWVYIARYVFGPLANGRFSDVVAGLAREASGLLSVFRKRRIAGGFLHAAR